MPDEPLDKYSNKIDLFQDADCDSGAGTPPDQRFLDCFFEHRTTMQKDATLWGREVAARQADIQAKGNLAIIFGLIGVTFSVCAVATNRGSRAEPPNHPHLGIPSRPRWGTHAYPTALAAVATAAKATDVVSLAGKVDAGEHFGFLSMVTTVGATFDHIVETNASLGLDLALLPAVQVHYRRAIEYGHSGDNWAWIIRPPPHGAPGPAG